MVETTTRKGGAILPLSKKLLLTMSTSQPFYLSFGSCFQQDKVVFSTLNGLSCYKYLIHSVTHLYKCFLCLNADERIIHHQKLSVTIYSIGVFLFLWLSTEWLGCVELTGSNIYCKTHDMTTQLKCFSVAFRGVALWHYPQHSP